MVFTLYYFELMYNQCPDNVFSCIYIYVLLCVLNKDQSINQSGRIQPPLVAAECSSVQETTSLTCLPTIRTCN